MQQNLEKARTPWRNAMHHYNQDFPRMRTVKSSHQHRANSESKLAFIGT
jgi:hypothetical protein